MLPSCMRAHGVWFDCVHAKYTLLHTYHTLHHDMKLAAQVWQVCCCWLSSSSHPSWLQA